MPTFAIPFLLLLGVILLKPKKTNITNTTTTPLPVGTNTVLQPAQPTPAPTTVTNNPNILNAGLLPRGIRNNNPGNIRITNDRWQGMSEVQTDGAFVQFVSPQYGFRAMTRILRNYHRRGINTIQTMISRWAPTNENHTAAYVNFVSKTMGIAPTVELDLSQSLLPLMRAITIYENGQDYARYYSDRTINEGIALA